MTVLDPSGVSVNSTTDRVSPGEIPRQHQASRRVPLRYDTVLPRVLGCIPVGYEDDALVWSERQLACIAE